jgi:hypothetical protein
VVPTAKLHLFASEQALLNLNAGLISSETERDMARGVDQRTGAPLAPESHCRTVLPLRSGTGSGRWPTAAPWATRWVGESARPRSRERTQSGRHGHAGRRGQSESEVPSATGRARASATADDGIAPVPHASGLLSLKADASRSRAKLMVMEGWSLRLCTVAYSK